MDIKLPKLGEGADSGVVVTVFVKEGDTVAKDQPLLELENEKAVASIPSPAAGTVAQVFVKPGDKLNVGQRILTLGGEGAPGASKAGASAAGASAARAQSEPAPAKAAPRRAAAVEPEPEGAEEPGAQGDLAEDKPSAPPAASPSIRRLAKELGIDLTRIRGSQRGGRIVMADLRAYIERLVRLAARPAAAAAQPSKPAAEPIDFSKWGPVTTKLLTPLRQTISRRMAESWATVARVTQFDEVDVTRLLALRKQHVAAYEERGTKLTLTGFILKALAAVLTRHPVFNASLDATGENLVFKSYYHIGIAVDTDAGLLVPVIRDADKKTLVELSRDLETVAMKARERKVTLDDLKGGTFTLSNQGGIGGAHFTPIINLPEVAILGIGRGAVKPVWIKDHVEPRTLVPLAVSYDHRVIDGGNAARFMVDLVQTIEGMGEEAVKL
ncbi:MAG TPA: 2-oxo acid dehydrogenase subunit E2 [Verrucomicrobiota bacterium]|nr:2-oxo acid dehydrogenase subunit E2 [Verrucomicrobiota bacterium]